MITFITVTGISQQAMNPIPENATLINQSSTAVMWISRTPNVTPGSGTPIQPLASITWQKESIGYVVTDTPADSPILIITDEITTYEDPIALGAAIAERLAVDGVTTNLVTEKIFDGQIAVGNTTAGWDISKYQSICISGSAPGGGEFVAKWLQYPNASDPALDTDVIYGSKTNPSAGPGVRLAVTGQFLTLIPYYVSTPGQQYINVLIEGSNQAVSKRATALASNASGSSYTLSTSPLTASTSYQLTQTQEFQAAVGYPLDMPLVTGMAYISCTFSGTAKGTLSAIIGTYKSIILINLADVINNHADKMVCLPLVPYDLRFDCTTAGTSFISVNIIPASY